MTLSAELFSISSRIAAEGRGGSDPNTIGCTRADGDNIVVKHPKQHASIAFQ